MEGGKAPSPKIGQLYVSCGNVLRWQVVRGIREGRGRNAEVIAESRRRYRFLRAMAQRAFTYHSLPMGQMKPSVVNASGW